MALAEVEEVINEGGYSLAENYLDNFKDDISASPEVIYAIPLHKKHASHNYLVNKCLVGAGAAAYGYDGAPWNGSCAVPQFIQSYDPDDQRLAFTWTGGVQRNAIKNADGTYTPQAGDLSKFDYAHWTAIAPSTYSL